MAIEGVNQQLNGNEPSAPPDYDTPFSNTALVQNPSPINMYPNSEFVSNFPNRNNQTVFTIDGSQQIGSQQNGRTPIASLYSSSQGSCGKQAVICCVVLGVTLLLFKFLFMIYEFIYFIKEFEP
ncbi:uncharacterized protein LOC116346234 [Contarinia nasturtii]|uniref:uncharacterized protein LOC116346234 n=1 Tax=Contarinia nasturtii TaxID=265458 RepID=UPI0012D48BC3|nr:uncharacterized protein LOC116346234 [Contarinia nasturtii]XP_031632029.1 uncharacterized protein LOC116346234 [Contarinia nasturtii]XP_031632030.1 uncharacterized protein LOC116346234 [Contarinia nasturtii]